MRKSDWQITVILLTKLYCLFFCWKTLTLAFKCFCWSETFAELLWSTWLMWRTSADLWKFFIHLWTHSSFQLFCNLYKSSISHCLSLFVCSYPNSFSHLSKNWLCLPPFSWFIAVLQAHVSGHFTSTIYWSNNAQTWRSSFKSPGCVNRLQFPLCS